MRTATLDAMVKGWFVGEFEPTALQGSACEVAIKRYHAGDREELHHHRIAAEVTAIVSGEVLMCGRRFGAGDIVVLEPGEATEFEAPTDTVNVVVKLPSVRGDKYSGT